MRSYLQEVIFNYPRIIVICHSLLKDERNADIEIIIIGKDNHRYRKLKP